MKGQKKIRTILESLYSRGVYDGIDMGRVPNDRFCGNSILRAKWEEDVVNKALKQIKEATIGT